jgi:hypothetical protein
MQNPTIKKLREAGFKVSVRHHRRWKFQPPSEVIIMKHENPAEASQLQEASKLPDTQTPGWKLCSTGGITEIHLTLNDITTVGRTECSVRNHYNKKNGRNKALGRALAEFEATTQLSVHNVIADAQQKNEKDAHNHTHRFLAYALGRPLPKPSR